MQLFDITVPAGQAFVVHAPGKYIKYLSGSNGGGDTRLTVTPGMQGSTKISLTPGQAYRVSDEAKKPDSWTLANYAGGAAIVGQVVVGDGRIDDNSIAGTVQVIDGGKYRSLSNAAFMAVTSAAPVAAQYSRVQLWNPASNPNRLVIEQVSINTGAQTGTAFVSSTVQLASVFEYGQPKKLGGTASAASACYDTTGTMYAIPLIGNLQSPQAFLSTWFKPNEPIIVPPGYGLICQANQANVSMTSTFEWYEEPNV